jgi:hypothetical protein
MDAETQFCFKNLIKIAMDRNVINAIFELKIAILHLEKAQGLVGKATNPYLDYDPAKKCLKQLISILESDPQENSGE